MKVFRRTEFHVQHARDGLIYDWARRDSRWLGKCAVVAVASVVFLVPVVMVRVALEPLPVQESASAGVMLIPRSSDPMGWLDRIRAEGPFPTRFDPAASQVSRAMIDAVLSASRDRSRFNASPRLLEFPGDSGVPPAPLVMKGERVLPRVPLPKYPSVASDAVRTQPVLYSLSGDPDGQPLNRPPYETGITTEMDSQAWRFLLKVAPNGKVIHSVAMVGHSAPGRSELARWLLRHRFPPIDGSRNRWIATAVTFRNQLIDEPHDP